MSFFFDMPTREKGPIGANERGDGSWLLFGNRPHDSTMTCELSGRGREPHFSASASDDFKRDALQFLRAKGLIR